LGAQLPSSLRMGDIISIMLQVECRPQATAAVPASQAVAAAPPPTTTAKVNQAPAKLFAKTDNANKLLVKMENVTMLRRFRNLKKNN
jgi:hypothetical protein